MIFAGDEYSDDDDKDTDCYEHSRHQSYCNRRQNVGYISAAKQSSYFLILHYSLHYY